MTTALLTQVLDTGAVEQMEASSDQAEGHTSDSTRDSQSRSRPRTSLGGWTWPIGPQARDSRRPR